ncbi:MAG: beta-galactosidase [bacterium]
MIRSLRLLIVGTLAGGMLAESSLCGGLEAKVAPYKGRNVIWVNRKPLAPLMYSGTEHSRETWAGQPRKSLEDFSALGYEIIQTDMWFKYSLRPDGTFDMAGVRKQLAGILEVNPAAKIVVRINVSAPGWWLERNTNEICRVTGTKEEKNTFGGNRAESLASEKYALFARESLAKFLEELAKTPEGDRVIGFHIGGGVYGEWHYYGIYAEPDASEPMRKTFSAFAKARYGTIERVNAAWLTTFKTLDEIVVPSYDRRYEVTDGDFRDPQRDRYVIDYYECQQAAVSRLVDGLCRLTKETWPRPTIVGLFYGYFFGNWTVGAQSSQFDIKTLFRSPYVDYFSGPLTSRNMYGSGHFRTLSDSVSLNGKVWISEHDTPTHLNRNAQGVGGVKWPDVPENEGQSIAIMRRNYMYTLTEGAGQWWYDFGPQNRSGWWGTPGMLGEAKRLFDLSNRLMEEPYAKPADVLVVHDMEAFNHVRPARIDKLTFKITEGMTDALSGTGAAFDRIFLMDLEKADLSMYKLVIFGNIFKLDAAQRSHIKQRVVAKGRSVVFLSGAGYTDGVRNDAALISDLVGMRVAKAEGVKPVVTITLGGQTNRLDADGVASLFKVTDGDARTVGTYASGEVGAAVKTVSGAAVYYFGLPPKTDLSFFKRLMREAGVRTYVENTVAQDYVAVGGGIIGIYSVTGGEKTIKPINGKIFKVAMAPFSTRYFDIRTGDELTRDL